MTRTAMSEELPPKMRALPKTVRSLHSELNSWRCRKRYESVNLTDRQMDTWTRELVSYHVAYPLSVLICLVL